MSHSQHYEYATAAFSSANARAGAEFNAEARADAQIQATLAIAYEQRTANLIALERLLQASGADIDVDAIQERLGLA
jgi:hypothetical protein